MCGVVTGNQGDAGLGQEVDREGDECRADEAQRALLAGLAGSGEFPQHDGAGADLDQAVEPEPCQRDRRGTCCTDGEHEHSDDVPTQRDALQPHSTAVQPCRVGCRCGLVHGVIVSRVTDFDNASRPLVVDQVAGRQDTEVT